MAIETTKWEVIHAVVKCESSITLTALKMVMDTGDKCMLHEALDDLECVNSRVLEMAIDTGDDDMIETVLSQARFRDDIDWAGILKMAVSAGNNWAVA
jgi:hypothetical protein